MIKVFVDGAHGTTGLEIQARLADRDDLALLRLDDDERRDPGARQYALLEADIAILCLPDDAARDAVSLAQGANLRFIDASSAHRVDPDWIYGFPELAPAQRDAIAGAHRVSNPGCYPTGFLALVRPLVEAKLVATDAKLSVNAVSGYSGGGKAMIAEFESGGEETALRTYALNLAHKHVAEMREYAGLTHPPLFTPAVTRTYRGMIVEVPLLDAPPGNALFECLQEYYAGSALICVERPDPADPVRIEADARSDRMTLRVYADDDRRHARLVATLDNLGKGAAGAAVQSLNLMAGLDETAGLRLGDRA